MDEQDSWWSEECRLADDPDEMESRHENCTLRACDCPCHNPRQETPHD